MARAIFQTIYDNVKQSIDDGTYAYQSYLPSETELTQLFDCSRMTVRRAISMLAADGYVLPSKAKACASFATSVTRRVVVAADSRPLRKSRSTEALSSRLSPPSLSSSSVARRSPRLPGFPKAVSSRAKRIRYADGQAVCSDDSYYLSSQVPGLTPEIVNDSIYRYLEEDLGIKIATGKRDVTIEHPTPEDTRVLDLDDFNALAVIRGQTYNADGILMEYTETKQVPGFFLLHETVTRNGTGRTGHQSSMN